MKLINRLLMQVEPKENRYLSSADLEDDGLWHTVPYIWDGRDKSGQEAVERVYESLDELEAAYPGEHVIIADGTVRTIEDGEVRSVKGGNGQ